MEKTWSFFACPRSLLNLDIVLNCGQCFRWSKHETGEWVGVVGKRIWILKQDSEQIFYKSIGSTASDSSSTLVENGCQSKKAKRPRKGRATHFYVPEADVKDLKAENEEAVLKDYFQLKIDLEGLYEKWSMNDQVFNKLSQNFGGLRMLRQDPVENLFSFICSQNNHITRIASMVNKLCANYGQLINNVGGKPYYEFPTVSALSSDDVDGNLRKLGFGYRAKFINQCAKQVLKNGGNTWLYTLRETPYKEAHSALCELPGVGAKVADCVCLMSLDKTEAVPVDTHMWQIAQRDYLPHLKKYKTLTDKIYQEIGDHFRGIYGDYAGWAHSVLFSADLRRFKELKEDALQPLVSKRVEKLKADYEMDEKTEQSSCAVEKTKVLKRQNDHKEKPRRAAKKKKVK